MFSKEVQNWLIYGWGTLGKKYATKNFKNSPNLVTLGRYETWKRSKPDFERNIQSLGAIQGKNVVVIFGQKMNASSGSISRDGDETIQDWSIHLKGRPKTNLSSIKLHA